jgi:hypothetical protein
MIRHHQRGSARLFFDQGDPAFPSEHAHRGRQAVGIDAIARNDRYCNAGH